MKVWVFLFIIICEMLLGEVAYAQFSSWSSRQGPASIAEKSDNKYQDIWSLSDWFEEQRKVRLMDQWLSVNSSSNPFEFWVSGQTGRYDEILTKAGVKQDPQPFNATNGTFGAFASIIGLQGQYVASTAHYNEMEGSVYLRLLGRSQQGTHLGGFYGLSVRDFSNGYSFATNTAPEKFSQQFAGGDLTLNFTKFFGIEGTYKKYFNNTSSLNDQLGGYRLEATFFIDFKFIRVYGTWFDEKDLYTNLTTVTPENIENRGLVGGIKFFF